MKKFFNYFRWWTIFLAMAMIVGMLSAPPAHAALTDMKFSKCTLSHVRSTVCQTFKFDSKILKFIKL